MASQRSLAYGCARHFRAAGADLAVTYLNAKAEKYVRPLTSELGCQIARQCDVSIPDQLEAVFEEIATKWGRLDFALHSIGYARAEDLHGRIIDCSVEGFAHAMQVSVHLVLRMAKLAEPVVRHGFETPGCACSGGQG
jgi:enoyl-[acyl-carrier protein] reductase I